MARSILLRSKQSHTSATLKHFDGTVAAAPATSELVGETLHPGHLAAPRKPRSALTRPNSLQQLCRVASSGLAEAPSLRQSAADRRSSLGQPWVGAPPGLQVQERGSEEGRPQNPDDSLAAEVLVSLFGQEGSPTSSEAPQPQPLQDAGPVQDTHLEAGDLSICEKPSVLATGTAILPQKSRCTRPSARHPWLLQSSPPGRSPDHQVHAQSSLVTKTLLFASRFRH